MTIQSTNVVSFNNAQNTSNQVNSTDGNEMTMSHLVIAELAEKRSDNVKRTIDKLVEQGVIQLPQIEEVPQTEGKREVLRKNYMLNQRDSYVVMAQVNPVFTGKLVDRWMELEEAARVPTPLEVAQTMNSTQLGLLLSETQAKESALEALEANKETLSLVQQEKETLQVRNTVLAQKLVGANQAVHTAAKASVGNIVDALTATMTPTELAERLREDVDPRFANKARCSRNGVIWALKHCGFITKREDKGYSVSSVAAMKGYGKDDKYGNTFWSPNLVQDTQAFCDALDFYIHQL